jgi:hypothetical protein
VGTLFRCGRHHGPTLRPTTRAIARRPCYQQAFDERSQEQNAVTGTAILWPMIAHAALVYAIYGLIAIRRSEAVKAGSARVSQFRENRDEPQQSLFVRNNLANQFELPVLFHACCLALFASGGVGTIVLALGWVFVASRVAHAAIHVTTNRIAHRQPAFLVGFVALGAMWAALAIHIA